MRSTMQDGLMWVCPACGARNLNHYENCVSCGRARPPPPDRAPSDVPLPETGRAPACRMIFRHTAARRADFQNHRMRATGRLMGWPMPIDITELVFLAVIGVVALVLIVTA
jgi:hypothetical protein